MFKTFPIVLDITKHQLNDMFQVNSNDLNTVRLNLSIKSGLDIFDLTGKIVRIAIKKPDGFIAFQTGGVTDPSNGLCEFILDRQAYLVEGKHEAEVMIYQDDSTVIVTERFYYKVNRAIANDKTLISTNHLPAINQAIIAGEQLKDIDIPEFVEAANSAYETIEEAETQGLYAKGQGDYAKQEADRAAQRVTELNGVDAVQFKDRQDYFDAQMVNVTKKNEVSITDFENKKVGDDWFPSFQAALTAIGTTGSIKFPGKTTYNMYSPLVLPLTGHRIRLFSNDGATISAKHNGDAIVLNAQNENYSAHIVDGLVIQGPNTSYPASGYVPPSTGAGIRMNTAYYCTLRDVRIQGFQYGVYLKLAIKNNFEGNTYIRHNQYGVYFDGGATNVNNFKGIGIRENRKAGVYFNAGTAPYPTHNTFTDCLIESNIPYPVVAGTAPNDSMGVYLGGSYYNIFDNCYFENQQYAIYLTGSSDGNKFNKCRFSPSADFTRLDKVMFDGAGVNNNTFTECISLSQDITSPNVEANNVNQLYNQFINCEGFTFIPASVLAPIDVINLRPNQSGWGTPFGALVIPSHGYYNNPGEGTTRGRITGIGTTTATLNAEGYGELMLGSLITAATTITNITNLKKGQYFTLGNYQINFPVTLKSSTDGINGLVLKNLRDAVLKKRSDTILFYVTQLGKIVEVGRNFNEEVINIITSSPSYVGQVAVVGGISYIATGTASAADWKQNSITETESYMKSPDGSRFKLTIGNDGAITTTKL